MRRPTVAVVWDVLAVGWAALVLALLETPSPPALPGSWMPGPVQPFLDKIGHAGLFFVQGALVDRALLPRLGRRRSWLAALIVVLALGAGTEIAQRWVPPRESSLGDLGADAAGGLLYVALLLAERSRSRSATGSASASGS